MFRQYGGSMLLALFLPLLVRAADEGRLMTYPDIHGKAIVFTYEGDLWTTTTAGGTAARLTSHPGREFAARFSPDGTTLAFTAQYDDGTNAYLMPAGGGTPTRLTYLPRPLQTLAWTPDGSRIIFRSMFDIAISRDPMLYGVGRTGTLPERLPVDRGVLCSFSPDGASMLYCRRGNEEHYWKRYKGGQYQDIWRYDFTTNTFTAVTDYVGKNSYPMWIGDTMFFVSDRAGDIANIYALDLTTRHITQITAYTDVDVMMPSTDGATIIYLHDGYLHLLDVRTRAITRLHLNIPSDRWKTRARTIDAKNYVHAADIANDGKTVLVEARGDLYAVAGENKPALNLSATAGTREMYPALSPDGQTVAFLSDKSSEYQIYTQSVKGGAWTRLTTTLDRTTYRLVWSPDGRKILFGNKNYALFVLDAATKKLTRVDTSNQMKNDEFTWEMADYGWSPDSKWICYSLVQFNRNNQIFLYSLERGTRTAVTDDFFDNLHPRFDAGGRYLYYLSSRNFSVAMDFYEDNHVLKSPQQVMVVQLAAGDTPPFAEAANPGLKAADPFRIDVEGIQKRTFPLPVPAGNYFFLQAGRGKVAWCSVPQFTESEYQEIFKPGAATKWELHIFDMEQKKEVTLGEKIREFRLSVNGERLLTRKENDFDTTTVEKAYRTKTGGGKLALSTLPYTVDNQLEWNQIFSDAWRWYRDFFYDPDMHGRDWKKLGEFYRAYIPALSSREELNWVLSQMVGELCVSHTYISGGDMGPVPLPTTQVFTGWLGADLSPDPKGGFYRFTRIYGPTEYNLDLTAPLSRPDIKVQEGHYLIAINGTQVKPPADYHRLLQISPGQKITVTVNAVPSLQGATTYEVVPIRYDASLRYFRWLTDNIQYVLKASNGKVGYMHINAMGAGGIGEFDKFWRAFRYKDGLIIDVRRNSGGWTEYFMIDKLERKMIATNVLKNMVPFRYPGSASSAQYVALSNEQNGSDGEAFIEHFKARKLGTVVGVPSWGGLVGILNGQTTIDNGSVQQSNNAFFGAEGKWLVENHGADPDVFLDNDPASVMAGRDLQLEKALEVVLKKIAENPSPFPARPPYPKK
jgi:tricorn protease